jgi:hypothetical protein
MAMAESSPVKLRYTDDGRRPRPDLKKWQVVFKPSGVIFDAWRERDGIASQPADKSRDAFVCPEDQFWNVCSVIPEHAATQTDAVQTPAPPEPVQFGLFGGVL